MNDAEYAARLATLAAEFGVSTAVTDWDLDATIEVVRKIRRRSNGLARIVYDRHARVMAAAVAKHLDVSPEMAAEMLLFIAGQIAGWTLEGMPPAVLPTVLSYAGDDLLQEGRHLAEGSLASAAKKMSHDLEDIAAVVREGLEGARGSHAALLEVARVLKLTDLMSPVQKRANNRVGVQVLSTFGRWAELMVPGRGPDNPLRVPAGEIVWDTGLSSLDLPGKHFTAIIAEDPENGMTARKFKRV